MLPNLPASLDEFAVAVFCCKFAAKRLIRLLKHWLSTDKPILNCLKPYAYILDWLEDLL